MAARKDPTVLVSSTVQRLLQTSVDRDDDLLEVGMDSLMMEVLRDELERALDIQLPVAFVFDYPTVKTITQFVKETIVTQANAPVAPAAPAPAPAAPAATSAPSAPEPSPAPSTPAEAPTPVPSVITTDTPWSTLRNRYPTGLIVVPAVFHMKKLLQADIPLSTYLGQGHVMVALSALQSAGIVTVNTETQIARKTAAADEWIQAIPERILDFLSVNMRECWESGKPEQTRFVDLLEWYLSARNGFQYSVMIRDCLDGVLLAPLICYLQFLKLAELSNNQLILKITNGTLSRLVGRVLSICFGTFEGNQIALNTNGKRLWEHAMEMGVCVSYRPLLVKLPSLLFGNNSSFVDRTGAATESHVDREINVVASGATHRFIFVALEHLVLDIFNNPDIRAQPSYIADMGCGDGSLLVQLYKKIAENTLRGKNLNSAPLCMIGVDLNKAALEVAAETLKAAKVPHLVIFGDVNNPRGLLRDFEENFLIDTRQVLHVRTFIDHEHAATIKAATAEDNATHPCAVDPKGNTIKPSVVAQSLRQHLQKWSSSLGPHGMVIAEVHALHPEVVLPQLDQTISLPFDALHGWSRQLLVYPQTWLLSAGGAGLFPKAPIWSLPKGAPRITVSHFAPLAKFAVRPLVQDDVATVKALQEQLPKGSQVEPEFIASTLRRFPSHQFVLLVGQTVVGCLLSQRIQSADELREGLKATDLPKLANADGTTLQIIAAIVDKSKDVSAATEALLSFSLQYFWLLPKVEAICGVVPSPGFAASGVPINEYIQQGSDPVLAVYAKSHAQFGPALSAFRDDADSGNFGVVARFPKTLGRHAAQSDAQDHD